MDCKVTENYFKEKARMCSGRYCCECLLGASHNTYRVSCRALQDEHPQDAIAIVQKWSDEHPQKTYKDDFYEKFPSAKTRYTPSGCVNTLYGLAKHCEGDCDKCWNEVMPE